MGPSSAPPSVGRFRSRCGGGVRIRCGGGVRSRLWGRG